MNSTRNVPLPPLFLQKFQNLIPANEFDAFSDALDGNPVSGLRVNTLKISVEEFRKLNIFDLGENVPWCPQSFFLPGTQRLGQHPFHAAGLYYLQDPSAMLPAQLLAPKPGEWVLDLSAAPGGKTTQLAALMQGKGLLVANEIKNKRIGHLIQNVERWGAGNVLVTNETPERLADTFGAVFDAVLVDAPCSGEGMFRKDQGARAGWTQQMVEGCAVRQRNILAIAAKLVRPGGRLLYSTCTFSPEEDEGVIDELLRANPDFSVAETQPQEGFDQGQPQWIGAHPSLRHAVRLFPHKVQGEGHFACLLHRQGSTKTEHTNANPFPKLGRQQNSLWQSFSEETLATPLNPERITILGDRLYYLPEQLPPLGNLRIGVAGVWLGTVKKDRIEPAHPMALMLPGTAFKKRFDLPIDGEWIAAYLKGMVLEGEGSGWTIISADGVPIGWGKAVHGQIKNHYPHGWMQLAG